MASSQGSSSASGVIIPLYSYPGSTWNAIIEQKQANPSVPVTVVVNPSSGPGSSQDPNYAAWINSFRAAGINVLGYVYTSYASRSASSVEADIGAYKSWYSVNGIFLDEMSNQPGYQSYYSSLTSYAHSLGLSMVVGNPGTSVPSSYVGTVDILVIYEDSGMPSASTLASSTMGLSKTDFAMVSYGVPSLNSFSVQTAAGYVGYLYITNEGMPNPYASLPSYFPTLMSDLQTSSKSSLVIQSTDLNGNPVSGLWTTVASNGNIVATGYTPLTFAGNTGAQYTVTVSNYGQYTFSHWENGNTDPSRTVVLTQSMTLIASYSTSVSISVQSINLSGSAFSGMWTTVSDGGNTVASGFTPMSFVGSSGSTYTVCVANYQNYVFDHWDNLSTNPCRVVTLTQSVSWNATYYT